MENIAPIDLELIEEGTVVKIEVTTDLYKRLQALIFQFFPFKDIKHFTEIIAKVKNNETSKDPLAYHLETIVALLNQIEDAAKNQGKVIKKQYDPVKKEIIKS